MGIVAVSESFFSMFIVIPHGELDTGFFTSSRFVQDDGGT